MQIYTLKNMRLLYSDAARIIFLGWGGDAARDERGGVGRHMKNLFIRGQRPLTFLWIRTYNYWTYNVKR